MADMDILKINVVEEEPFKRHGKLLQKKTRVYFWIQGQTLIENFARRFTNPSREYRKFLPAVFEKLGLPADTVANWNRYAGCTMCPCSPGFILKGHNGKEAHVTIGVLTEKKEEVSGE